MMFSLKRSVRDRTHAVIPAQETEDILPYNICCDYGLRYYYEINVDKLQL